ncbi:adenylyltransferase/cytidyltransferase family protein [Pseudoalteromonas sp. OOF1S-7]|uniref:adenylyltransferase/cytidyltransferase family protein n=1 Tax=Pseudoalteromonas sp. OOF1S-7 TaxID=2917757 RepID=UPI001EF4A333|nr:adenylyltransferase/cytidyltransferase family protein [Pseudoalteromonas sp. OOF1S-7]MCG7537127.1 adenylyltransferase/cytidyltransferase family protein [Pseudoalteromonas sp. OOF1S-7]
MIYQLYDLEEKIARLKASGKTVGLCHGCFDIIHTGHVRHFNYAKKMCDFLFVSVTADQFVNKGPGRPVFRDAERAEILASLSDIDGSVISHSATAELVLSVLQPSIYFKGQEYQSDSTRFSANFQKELGVASKLGVDVVFTQEKVDSSTRIIDKIRL